MPEAANNDAAARRITNPRSDTRGRPMPKLISLS
jgi:hypothetical protein